MTSVLRRFFQSFLLVTLALIPLTAISSLPKPPPINAKGHILIDAMTGSVLAEENADETLEPASLTKVMTDYIAAFEIDKGRLSLDDKVHISVKAWKMGGSRMFLKEGTEVKVEDILRGIAIQSGNDAAVAIAEHIAGGESAFADIMNEHADRLGMTNTNFVNATGWPHDDQYTSARDMAILSRALIQDFPDNYALYKEKHFTYNKIRQGNRNLLLWRDNTVDGVKTGHTESAGYNLIASAKRDDLRLISVVIGTTSEQARAAESQKLLSYGFRNFKLYSPFKQGDNLDTRKVWLGKQKQISLGVAEDLHLVIPKGSENKLEISIDTDKNLRAPIKKGDELGKITVHLDDQVLSEKPVIANHDIEKAGIFKSIFHYLVLFVTSLF